MPGQKTMKGKMKADNILNALEWLLITESCPKCQ